MKLFVTGGTGFVGAAFLHHSVDRGHEVKAIRRRRSSVPDGLEEFEGWLEGDLSGDYTNSLGSTDCLVHLASAGVNPATISWEQCLRVNLEESLQLWRRAAESGVRRMVIVGSCFEYGRAALKYDRVPVDAPLEPTDPYGASKAAASLAASALAEQLCLDVTVARLFHVYGEGEPDYRFWPSLRKAAFAGEDFPMTAGEQVRDFTAVREVAEKLLDLCERPVVESKQYEVVHVGTGEPRTLLDFARSEWRHFDAAGELKPGEVPYRENEVMSYVPEI